MRIYPAIHYTMGGLWVDYHLQCDHSRAVRAGRGELLRPRREPAGRERADAGALRRLLHHSLHDRQLPGDEQAGQGRGIKRRGAQCRRMRERDHQQAAFDQGQADGGLVPSRAGQDHVGVLRDVAHAEGLRDGDRADPRAARGVLAERKRAGHRRGPEPEPGKGRARGGLPGAGRADVHRRAGAQRKLRRPFPRGVPDAGWRGEARR